MDVEDILKRPYTRIVERGDDGVFTSSVLEIPGVISEGDTPAEALENLEDAFHGVVESLLAHNEPIPEPYGEHEYSGRLQLRLTPAMHRRAALYAQRQGVSLNRILSDAVATYVAGTPRED